MVEKNTYQDTYVFNPTKESKGFFFLVYDLSILIEHTYLTDFLL